MNNIDEAPAHLRAAITSMHARLVSDGQYRTAKRGKKLPPWVVSIEGARAALLLEYWLGGLHHLPGRLHTSDVDWSGRGVEIVGSFDLSTYDFSGMTRLVLLAHEHSIRAEVSPRAFQCVRLSLHPRPILSPGERMNTTRHHPDLDVLRVMVDQAKNGESR